MRCRLALVVGAVVVSACGSASAPAVRGPQPPPGASRAEAQAVAVIKAWSEHLRQGDVRGAARYFALPSLLVNGPGPGGEPAIAIRTFAQAVAANEALPCGAEFVSAQRHGPLINVLFTLVDRPGPGGGCGGGVGGTARTDFLIEHGRIVEWIRAPDEPGDGGNQGPGVPTPPPGGGPATPAV